MYKYSKNDYVYNGYGGLSCSPTREIRTVSDKEAKYWDRIEKEIRQLEAANRSKKSYY